MKFNLVLALFMVMSSTLAQSSLAQTGSIQLSERQAEHFLATGELISTTDLRIGVSPERVSGDTQGDPITIRNMYDFLEATYMYRPENIKVGTGRIVSNPLKKAEYLAIVNDEMTKCAADYLANDPQTRRKINAFLLTGKTLDNIKVYRTDYVRGIELYYILEFEKNGGSSSQSRALEITCRMTRYQISRAVMQAEDAFKNRLFGESREKEGTEEVLNAIRQLPIRDPRIDRE